MKGENKVQARRVWQKSACEEHSISGCGVKLHDEAWKDYNKKNGMKSFASYREPSSRM